MAGRNSGKCKITNCREQSFARGWCRSHYHQWRRTASPVDDAKTGGDERNESERKKDMINWRKLNRKAMRRIFS